MKKNILSKEEFVKVIERTEKAYRFDDEIKGLYMKWNLEAPENPELIVMDSLIDTLDKMFELPNNTFFGSDIAYFIFELDFGKKYEPGCVKDDNGNEIDFSSAEALYDYILKRGNNK